MSSLTVGRRGCVSCPCSRPVPCTTTALSSQPVLRPKWRPNSSLYQRHVRLANVAKLSCSCHNTGHSAEPVHPEQKSQTRNSFTGFLWKQSLLAAGTVALALCLVRPLAQQWQARHQPVTDAMPAAVWLPRAADTQPRHQPGQSLPVLQRAAFGAVTSNLPAASGRLLRITDAVLMQLTVTLQQVCMLSLQNLALQNNARCASMLYSIARQVRGCICSSHCEGVGTDDVVHRQPSNNLYHVDADLTQQAVFSGAAGQCAGQNWCSVYSGPPPSMAGWAAVSLHQRGELASVPFQGLRCSVPSAW